MRNVVESRQNTRSAKRFDRCLSSEQPSADTIVVKGVICKLECRKM